MVPSLFRPGNAPILCCSRDDSQRPAISRFPDGRSPVATLSIVVASFGEEEGAQLRGLQPRALIVTIYGLYAREVGGWLSVAALIRLMADLGIDEPAVRSSISRLKRRGILEAEEHTSE